MKSYQIENPDEKQVALLSEAFPRLVELGGALRDQVLCAWCSVVASSSYDTVFDVPFSHGSTDRLVDHTNDVVEAGLALNDMAARQWGWEIDRQRLVAILLLHDLDKPLLMDRRAGEDHATPVSLRIPHGVLAAMLLAELGVGEEITAAVATHATHAPLRGPDREVLILHYADLFAADKALLDTDRMPFFRRCPL
ncbi:HD domain-containing protein [Celeribacter sp.]|uniref:HD domain-containing protein n=1 Tax=Celeribacter sp. TaxID=1890673 RepID=UPI003A9476BE